MVIVLVRSSSRDVPRTQLLIPSGELFQCRVALSYIAFNQVAVLMWSDLDVRSRGRSNWACPAYFS